MGIPHRPRLVRYVRRPAASSTSATAIVTTSMMSQPRFSQNVRIPIRCVRRFSLLQSLHELLEPGIVAQNVVVGIVLYPIALPPAPSEHAFENFDRFFFLAGSGMEACGVEQGAHVIGVKLERSLGPLDGARR